MSNSFFKGWNNVVPNTQLSNSNVDMRELFFGQVLDIYYDEQLPAKIRVRVLGNDREYVDEDVKTEALPINYNTLKVPLPGELVLLVSSKYVDKNEKTTTSKFYYFDVLTTKQNIGYNGNPYIGLVVPTKMAEKVYTPDYKDRFDQKFYSLISFKSEADDSIKTKSRLKPFEGDVILQGRFGASIRFSSSSGDKETTPWSNNKDVPGNPLIIMSANDLNSETSVENVNADDSSVYICSTQEIGVEMSTSQLYTQRHVYGIQKPISVKDEDLTNFLMTTFQPMNPANLPPGLGDGNLGTIGSDFGSLVTIVIDTFEGGYWSDKWFTNSALAKKAKWPYDKRYANSGETMYGIDRKAGGSLNTGPAGVAFWQLIDAEDAPNNWSWGYRGGALEPKLKQLATEILSPRYTELSNNNFTQQTLTIINSDPRLVMHMVYGVWNGPGWFQKFAKVLNNAVAAGTVDTNQLTVIALNSRINEGLQPGSAPNSLIKQGGEKMRDKLFPKLLTA